MSRTIACAFALIVATTAGAAREKGPPPATPAGEATDCVSLSNIREARVRDDRTIDFIMRNGTVYRNTLAFSCPQLGFEQSFSYKTSLSRLCSVDIITVLQHAGGIRTGASCGLGTFQPVKLLPR